MKNVKEIVVEYLTKQIELNDCIEQINALSEQEKKAKVNELYDLMCQTHPYVSGNVLKNILFSEPHLQGFVLMVQLAVDTWREKNQTATIIDAELLIKKMAISVLNGMFNPELYGVIKYV